MPLARDEDYGEPHRTERRRRRHEPLPNWEELVAIDDRADLDALRAEVERNIVRIETDLDFRDAGEDWAVRARGALTHHRHTVKLIDRRIRKLTHNDEAAAEPARRDREDCDPLGLELVDGRSYAGEEYATPADVDAAIAALGVRIQALELDRVDENDRPNAEKDLRWLQEAKVVLNRARGEQNALMRRAAEMRRTERIQAAEIRDQMRERLFIDAARKVLDQETYLRLWAEVDRLEAAGEQPAEPAARPEAA